MASTKEVVDNHLKFAETFYAAAIAFTLSPSGKTPLKTITRIVISMTKTDKEALERKTGLPVGDDGYIQFPRVDVNGRPLTERDQELLNKLHAGPLLNQNRSNAS